MHVQVDQSVKIGDTKDPTVLAFSDTESFSILIPARVKRACLRELRGWGKSGTTLYLQLFAAALFLLLKGHLDRITLITIDLEYPGHSPDIKEHLLNLFARAGFSVSGEMIRFQRIGKRSPAHDKALYTLRGELRPDRTITTEELLAQFK
ncbi:MAG: hypothetical protein FJ014_12195 [Chloroflexi bacterium]|nr:hypothetical protein [Chloroflexota bacterium]